MITVNGIKFGKHGVKDQAGKYTPCYFSISTHANKPGNWAWIHSKSILKDLPATLKPTNGTDTQSDYFESDRAIFAEGTPEFAAVKAIVDARNAEYAARRA